MRRFVGAVAGGAFWGGSSTSRKRLLIRFGFGNTLLILISSNKSYARTACFDERFLYASIIYLPVSAPSRVVMRQATQAAREPKMTAPKAGPISTPGAP